MLGRSNYKHMTVSKHWYASPHAASRNGHLSVKNSLEIMSFMIIEFDCCGAYNTFICLKCAFNSHL